MRRPSEFRTGDERNTLTSRNLSPGNPVPLPELREAMWGGSLWSDGYFVRATGDAVTSVIIQRSIRYQRRHEEGPRQLRFNF